MFIFPTAAPSASKTSSTAASRSSFTAANHTAGALRPSCRRAAGPDGYILDDILVDATDLLALVVERGERGGVLCFQRFVFSAIDRHWWKRFGRNAWDEFDGVPVLEIGCNGPFAHDAFLRQIESPFRVFSDVDGYVMDELELGKERDGMAQTTSSAVPCSSLTPATRYSTGGSLRTRSNCRQPRKSRAQSSSSDPVSRSPASSSPRHSGRNH